MYIYVTGMKMGLEMRRQKKLNQTKLLLQMVIWHGCWRVHRRTMAVLLHMCSGFPTKMGEQMIVMS